MTSILEIPKGKTLKKCSYCKFCHCVYHEEAGKYYFRLHVCRCKKSNHFGHALEASNHPACNLITTKYK